MTEAVQQRRTGTNGERPSGQETGPTPPVGPLRVFPSVYRDLLHERNSRRFLIGLGVSSLGDAMSTVTVAWLAVFIAAADKARSLCRTCGRRLYIAALLARWRSLRCRATGHHEGWSC